VEHMIAEGRRASEIVQGIRSLTKRANPQKTRLELNDVVNDVMSLVQREVLNHRVSLRLKLASELPPLLGDRVQLQQVIINFVMNGIQAMADIGDAPRELLIESRGRRCTGLRNGHRSGKRESAVRRFLHHKARRNGHGIVDLPFNHRSPRRTGVGIQQCRAWCSLPIPPACDRRERVLTGEPAQGQIGNSSCTMKLSVPVAGLLAAS
jgi:light-regulated signal transduction histidine kinase (bacteriophytochrome)